MGVEDTTLERGAGHIPACRVAARAPSATTRPSPRRWRRQSDRWRDVALVNATRWALGERPQASGLPLETGTGGRTTWNRSRRQLPKTHWLDAACVGASTPERLRVAGVRPLWITATGRHARQLCRRDRCGFSRTGPKATSTMGRLRTDALVRAVGPPPSGQAGAPLGPLAGRAIAPGKIITPPAPTVC